MSFSVGIIGLPNVGKSTLFKALTKQQIDTSNYPFCTIDPNVGIVEVPDERLNALARLSKSKKIIPTAIEFVDIAGLVKNAHKGEGLGNKFLSHIKEVDAICHVVRDFHVPDVTHVEGEVNPKSDIETINLELIMADLATVTNRIADTQGQAGPGRMTGKTNDKDAQKLLEIYTKIKNDLDKGESPTLLTDEEKEKTKDLNLLTQKPTLYVLNIDEKNINKKPTTSNLAYLAYRQAGRQAGQQSIPISAKIESELVDLPPDEQKLYLENLGLKQSGLATLITASYKLLNLITYLTTGPEETRAWTIRSGALAPEAGSKIHSDFEEKFIRAEIINWQDLVNAGTEIAAREKGLLRTEGKNYVVQDGDVIHFKI